MIASSPRFVMIRIQERKKSGLTIAEWIAAEHISFISCQNEDGASGVGVLDALAFDHGWSRNKVQRILTSLLASGYIRKISRYEYKTTKKWNDLVNDKYVPEEVSQELTFNQFYESIKSEYPRKDFGSSDKKLIISNKLMDKKDEFITAIRNFKMTRDANNEFCMSFATFVDKWESYIDGVPAGVALMDGGTSSGKKIANGAADQNLSDFEKFIRKLEKMAYEIFQSGAIDSMDDDDIELYEFNTIEKAFIHDAGGFLKVIRDVLDADYRERMKPLWGNM